MYQSNSFLLGLFVMTTIMIHSCTPKPIKGPEIEQKVTLPTCPEVSKITVPIKFNPEKGYIMNRIYKDRKITLDVDSIPIICKGNQWVFFQEKEGPDDPRMADEEFTEQLIFAIDPPEGDRFSINHDDLAASNARFYVMCFCSQTGYMPLNKGTISGTKMENGEWEVTVDYEIGKETTYDKGGTFTYKAMFDQNEREKVGLTSTNGASNNTKNDAYRDLEKSDWQIIENNKKFSGSLNADGSMKLINTDPQITAPAGSDIKAPNRAEYSCNWTVLKGKDQLSISFLNVQYMVDENPISEVPQPLDYIVTFDIKEVTKNRMVLYNEGYGELTLVKRQ